MALNPSTKVADARAIAQKWDKHQVIIIALDRRLGTIEYASFGRTERQCNEAKELADEAFHAIQKAME